LLTPLLIRGESHTYRRSAPPRNVDALGLISEAGASSTLAVRFGSRHEREVVVYMYYRVTSPCAW
jgi:hypothetical protein